VNYEINFYIQEPNRKTINTRFGSFYFSKNIRLVMTLWLPIVLRQNMVNLIN